METLRSVHVLHAILPFVYFAVFESRGRSFKGDPNCYKPKVVNEQFV